MVVCIRIRLKREAGINQNTRRASRYPCSYLWAGAPPTRRPFHCMAKVKRRIQINKSSRPSEHKKRQTEHKTKNPSKKARANINQIQLRQFLCITDSFVLLFTISFFGFFFFEQIHNKGNYVYNQHHPIIPLPFHRLFIISSCNVTS